MALIRRLAEHSPDTKLAMILAKQGHRAATGLTFTASRVAGIRERADIPAEAPGGRRSAAAHLSGAQPAVRAAWRMSFVTSAGCEIYEAWDELISVV